MEFFHTIGKSIPGQSPIGRATMHAQEEADMGSWRSSGLAIIPRPVQTAEQDTRLVIKAKSPAVITVDGIGGDAQ